MEPIKLADGTELIALEPEKKEELEAKLKVILDEYEAMYLPVLKEEKSLTHTTQKATLFLLKRSGIRSPFIEENGESTNTTEETPKAD